MTSITANTAFETVERDGITLFYDTPRQTVYVGPFDMRQFVPLVLAAQAITLLMALDTFAYTPGFWNVLVFAVSGVVAAVHQAKLRVHTGTVSEAIRTGLGACCVPPAIAFGLQLVAQMTSGVWGIGFLAGFFYFIGSSALAIYMVRTGPAEVAATAAKEITVLPRAIVSIEVLRERFERMKADKTTLAALPVFDAGAADLTAAWEKKNTDLVERLLRAGDDLNRTSHQRAVAIFNAARDDIDLGRSRLRQLVKEAEAALVAYQINEAAKANRSGVLEGSVDIARLPAKDWTQKLNYSRGTGTAVAKAVAGNGSWQVAAAAVVFTGIMMAVNHQKLLRQLKEMEGQVKTQAAAVRGDIEMIGELFLFRIWPQLAGMLSLIGTMEDRLQGLQGAEDHGDADQAKADAFLLACTLREAKHVLEMKAGD